MTAMFLALFLYLLLRQVAQPHKGWYACRECFGLVRFDGRRFIFLHANGQSIAVNEPAERIDPLDDSSPLETHRATPVDYPLGRVA